MPSKPIRLAITPITRKNVSISPSYTRVMKMLERPDSREMSWRWYSTWARTSSPARSGSTLFTPNPIATIGNRRHQGMI